MKQKKLVMIMASLAMVGILASLALMLVGAGASSSLEQDTLVANPGQGGTKIAELTPKNPVVTPKGGSATVELFIINADFHSYQNLTACYNRDEVFFMTGANLDMDSLCTFGDNTLHLILYPNALPGAGTYLFVACFDKPVASGTVTIRMKWTYGGGSYVEQTMAVSASAQSAFGYVFNGLTSNDVKALQYIDFFVRPDGNTPEWFMKVEIWKFP